MQMQLQKGTLCNSRLEFEEIQSPYPLEGQGITTKASLEPRLTR